MKKVYQRQGGLDLYQRLLLEKGDKVRQHWLDCVIDMDSINHYREAGTDSFVVILRSLGAQALPVGINKEHSLTVVRHYSINDPDSLVYLLNYKEGTIYRLEWNEAEKIIEEG